MKKKTIALFLCIVTLVLSSCNSEGKGFEEQMSELEIALQHISAEQPEEEEFMYTFKACSPDLLPLPRANICNLYDDKTAEYHSLFIGQVLNLFGEPDYTTENNEDLYSKAVSAEDKEGNIIYLEVYYGPSGPAIGGDVWQGAEDSKKAADELVKFIMAAEPKDYEYKSGYEDVGITLRMGVKNGKPYYETDFPEDMLK